jgi:hypothetical protein
VIVGDEEAGASEAGVKALREEREQFRVPLEGLPNAVADLLFGESDDKGNQ